MIYLLLSPSFERLKGFETTYGPRSKINHGITCYIDCPIWRFPLEDSFFIFFFLKNKFWHKFFEIFFFLKGNTFIIICLVIIIQKMPKKKKCKKNMTRSDAKGRYTRQCSGLQPILHSVKTFPKFKHHMSF